MPTGQHWYVSVTVAKGAKPGKRVVLVSGVHGDEMSSVHTVQTVMNQLDPAEMSGTVMAVTDVSRPAMEGMQRRWPNSGRGTDLIDMNREWPGNENGVTATSRHAGLLFNRLLRPNADVAIDFHTGTTGFDVTAFNIASMDVPEIKAMVDLYPVGQIFDNHAYPGVLHNAFIDAGIPSFSPEIGAARVLDLEMIALFVEGTMNVLKHHGIVAGPMGRTGKDVSVFVGNSAFPILATAGRARRASGQAQRQGRSRTEGGHPAQQLRRGGCGIYKQRGRRGDGPAQRCNVRARQPPGIHPVQQGDAGGR